MGRAISFEKMPVWQGVQNEPGIKATSGFSLYWDKRGFISQDLRSGFNGLNEDYASDQYNFITVPPGTSEWANRLGQENIDFVISNYGTLSGKSILEIGAGSLYIAKKIVNDYGAAQYQVVDPAVREISDDARIQVIRDYFDYQHFKGNHYELIITLNCLEHVPNPVELLIEIRSLLSADGKAVLVFPDIEREFVDGDLNALLHEHISYFSYQMASDLMTRLGFKIIKGQSDEGCLRFLIENNPGLHRQPLDSCEPDSLFEVSLGSFNSSIQEANQNIRDAMKRRETIAFHGATNGLNNTLFLIGLTDCRDFLLFDGDEAKTGLYLPACPRPIAHSKDVAYKNCDRVFISAVTFYEEIKHFIVNEHGLDPEIIQPLFSMNANSGVK